MDGVVAIHKPTGMTSHDVVARVRRITGERSSGHTGTLDPDATGLLVICLGKATRLIRFMEEFPKQYEAEIVFGVCTNTGDASGREVERSEGFSIPFARFAASLGAFVGDIQQAPPMVSAVHYGGRRLYELAREGITVDRAPRTVKVFSIQPLEPLSAEGRRERLEFGARARIRVQCSRGTYIRTLCEDICRSLGVCGHMRALVRTETSGFTLDQSVTIESLERLAAQGALADAVMSPIEGVRHLPSLALTEHEARAVSHGTAFECDEGRIPNVSTNPAHVALMRPDMSLAAVATVKRSLSALLIQPRVVL